jgi:hypothetical protein
MQAEAAAAPLSLPESHVVSALRNAAAVTGSDFHYLLGTAMRESSLKPNAQSHTSSAAGLFQFIDQTWLGLVKDHGARHGLSGFAAAITKDAAGRYHAPDGMKDAILSLRGDPNISALMKVRCAPAWAARSAAASFMPRIFWDPMRPAS